MAAVRKRRTGRTKQWRPPDDYHQRSDLNAYLKSLSPRMHTSEWDMVVYWDWRTRPFWRKTVERAWRDLGMLPALARDAIDKRIVPDEVYDRALTRALIKGARARLRTLPRL